jgi:Polyketide cyclase / dehydrase and lipid transport
MPTYHASASALIPAPPSLVYGLIADYRNTHSLILPRPPFTFLDVDEGGVGAGTVVRFGMIVIGKEQIFHADISEPEPGRVLVEQGPPHGPVSTFTVDPADEGRQARVTIATVAEVRGGPLGWIERGMSAMYLRSVYVKELKQLAEVAKERAQAGT